MGWLNLNDVDRTVVSRPPHEPIGMDEQRWAKDGFFLRALDVNMLHALLRDVRDHFQVPDVEGDDTILRQAIALSGAQYGGYRNLLINGNFGIAQRGLSFVDPISGTFLLDRWFLSFSGSGASRTITRERHPLGSELPGRNPYFLRWDQSVAGTGATSNALNSRIEGVARLANKEVTVSFWARINTPSPGTFSLRWVQSFGTGGSPSALVVTNITGLVGFTIGTSWARYSGTVTIPSISGKTLGTAGNDSTAIQFLLPINVVVDKLDIADVQAEFGDDVTDFDIRSEAVELTLCRRYFERLGGNIANSHLGKGYANSTVTANFTAFYTEKRAIPTVTVTGGASDYELQRTGGTLVATTALSATASNIGVKSCQLAATVASGLTAGEGLGLKTKALTGTIDISAEV